MSGVLRGQIRNNLNLKDTDELLEIWQTNDRVEWSDKTFEVLEEILKERINEIPLQDDAILDPAQHKSIEDDDFEDWEMKLLDDENQPDFYDTLEVLTLKDKINRVALAVIVVNIVIGLMTLPTIQGMLMGAFPTIGNIPAIIVSFVVVFLGVGIEIIITYFPLKALAQILRILMEMEFNSRKAR